MTKSKAVATFTFLFMGGFTMLLGDLIAAEQLGTGRVIFGVGVLIFLIPFAYFFLNKKLPTHEGVNSQFVERKPYSPRTPSVRKAVYRSEVAAEAERTRRNVANHIVHMEEREQKKKGRRLL